MCGSLPGMEAAHVLRALRRHRGVEQRAFAAEVGVARSTLASWESGRRHPTAASLDRALAAAGLDLALVPRLDPADDLALRRHLQLSLTQRLRLALGESPVLLHATGHLWREMRALARRGQVVLEPPLATALWLPIGPVAAPRVSVFHPRTAISRGRIEVRRPDGDAPRSAIPFLMEVGEKVWVLPPGELARPTATETALRQADLMLHAQAARDDASRRRPAHRDPDEGDEDYRLLRTKSVTRRPDMRHGRGWRLRASASLAQRLREEMTG